MNFIFFRSFETALIEMLMKRLKKVRMVARPVKNSSDPVMVELGIGLISILELDALSQTLSTVVWIRKVRMTRTT